MSKKTVIGFGGRGCKAINYLYNNHLNDELFLIAVENSFHNGYDLKHINAHKKFFFGDDKLFSLEDKPEFLIAGLGSCNDGYSGGLELIKALKHYHERSVFPSVIVSMPFQFEGEKRIHIAQEQLQEIIEISPSVLVMPNHVYLNIIKNMNFGQGMAFIDNKIFNFVNSY